MGASSRPSLTLTLRVALASFCSLVAIAEPASARAYGVRACDAATAAVNNSWILHATAGADVTEAVTVCPSATPDPYGTVGQGLAIQDVLDGAPAPPDGAYREWRITAPATTLISSADVLRDIGNRGTLQGGAFSPYGRDQQQAFGSDTCFKPQGEFYCRIRGFTHYEGATPLLAWGIRCVTTTFCDGGYELHHVWVSIRSAIVTIDDPVDPLISEATGPLSETGRWHRGTEAVTLAGSDVTGIRQVGVYKGTTPVVLRTAPSAQAGGCGQLNSGLAYTFTKPCEGSRGANGPQVLELNTVGLGDGTSTLRLVVRDTAGNEADRPLVVKVDNEPPAVRQVEANGSWSAAPDARWSWTGSSEADRAPVAKVEVERCLGSQGCAVEELPGDSFSGVQSYSHLVPEGESTLRVREIDAAGNVGGWSDPAVVRRDRTTPVVAVSAPEQSVAGEALVAWVAATDGLSGVVRTEVEVRTDGGAWRPHTEAERPAAGTVLRFRGRAVDAAQNASGWSESGDVRIVSAPAPTLPPEATPTPGPGAIVEPQRPATGLRRTRIIVRNARRTGRRVIIRGRVAPAAAKGTIRAGAGRQRARARIRGGTFTLRLRVRGFVGTVKLSYRGDARHTSATRRVRIRTAR